MATKIRPCLYEVGSLDDATSVGVVKGEKANFSKIGSLRRHMGMKKSKWYVYEEEELLAYEKDHSGTRVVRVTHMKSEHDTKKGAVEWAEQHYDL